MGTVSLPGDKSISHRAALLAAIALGRSSLNNFSSSQDCASTLKCLAQLGVSIERADNTVIVEGVGLNGLTRPSHPLDCGNSGSTIRMLAGILAAQNFDSTLTGDKSLRSRPMKRIIEPLERMGASIVSADGKPPLQISGRKPLQAMRYEMSVASAQVKTSLLFAGLFAEGRTEVLECAGQTRDHTERILKWFGIQTEDISLNGVGGIALNGPVNVEGRDTNIPGDFSAAAFMIAAAALLPGSELLISEVGLNPTRTKLLEIFRLIGTEIGEENLREECNEPVGSLRVRGNEIESPREGGPLIISGALSAALIDELPLIAVIGTQMAGGIVVRDASELRKKESDRIAAMVENLRLMGAKVEEHEDGFSVAGKTPLRGAKVDACTDHRIAMALGIAALIADGETEINGADCVAISFPDFLIVCNR